MHASALLVAAVSLAIGVSFVLPSAAGAATLGEKRAEAAKIADQVAHLDTQLDALNERHRDATRRMDQLSGQLARLNGDLLAQQRALDVALVRLQRRAVTVYESGDGSSVLVKLIQSGSINQILDRADAISRVSHQDAAIVSDIRTLREQVRRQRTRIGHARSDQHRLVVQARKDAAAIARRKSARAAVLSSVNGEIRTMVAAEQAAAAARAAAASRAAAARLGAGTGAAATGVATSPVVTSAGTGGTAAAPSQPDAAVSAPPAPSTSTDVGAALSNPAPPPPSSGHGGGAAGAAMGQIGVKYVWGGSTPSGGFDCSGLVMWAFAQAGVSLPHSSYAQWNAGTHVTRDQLQVGDLIFSEGLGHVGIYVGGGSYVHAPHTGDVVKVSPLPSGYVGAVRVA